jgi:hypothetical protein
LYKATILPLLDYSDVYYSKDTVTFTKKLQLLQNRALRVIYKVALKKDPLFTLPEMHAKANLLLLKDRRDLHMANEAARLLLLGKYTKPPEIAHRTRYNSQIKIYPPKSKHPYFHNSPIIRIGKIWNSLPNSVTSTLNTIKIKNVLRKHFYSKLNNDCDSTIQ